MRDKKTLIKENELLKKRVEELETKIVILEHEKEEVLREYEEINEKIDCGILSWNY